MCNDCKAMVFDLGRVVLGDNSGGVVNKLIKLHGIRSASKILKLAHRAESPLDYVGGALRRASQEQEAAVASFDEASFEIRKANYYAKLARTQ